MTSAEWLDYHAKYEKYARPVFNRALKASYQPILNNLHVITYANYKAITAFLLDRRPMESAYTKVYSRVGLIHGKRVGYEINRQEKRFMPEGFSSDWMAAVLEWVRTNLGQRITQVNDYTIELIQNLIETSLERNYTITQMRLYLEQNLGSAKFNRMRSLRIARTETTTAANFGAFKAAENTDYEMTKEWISVMDDRTRGNPSDKTIGGPDHWHIDGVKVDQYEPFVLSDGTKMQYPGDQSAPGKQVINCRCTYNFRAKRDEEGEIIMRTTKPTPVLVAQNEAVII